MAILTAQDSGLASRGDSRVVTPPPVLLLLGLSSIEACTGHCGVVIDQYCDREWLTVAHYGAHYGCVDAYHNLQGILL